MSLSMGTPSITKSASLAAGLIDDSPRSVTRIEPPGPAPAWFMLSPATLPAIPLSQLLEAALFSSSALIFETAYPSDFSSRLIPSAVTTTSLIVLLSSWSTMSMDVRLPTMADFSV